MKKILLTAMIGFAGLVTANTTGFTSNFSKTLESKSVNFFKKIKIDEYITDTNGTSWHIYGWVDVSVGWSGPKINHYDIHMVGGGHHYHFQGKIMQEQGANGDIKNTIDGTLTDDEKGTKIEIDNNLQNVLYQLNDNVIKNNPE
ncbi:MULTISPECIES: hypothetical protein [Chryseobacterium]|uniref:Uncharacterized protein n=3 Tax=Chryseobacterium TaxID=59732 RepID=A0AAU6WM88_9FLAO|nr:hypothetical protein [uncultured Chryseobacterium sp.]